MALRTMIQHASRSCNGSLSALSGTSSNRAYSQFVNNVELLGRVGREPQKVGANDAVVFPLFTESTIRLKDGSTKTFPTWHKVLVPGKPLADIVVSNLDRGQRCYIHGRLAYRAPEITEEGKTIHSYQAVIIANKVVFLEKSRKFKNEEESESSPEADAQAQEARS